MTDPVGLYAVAACAVVALLAISLRTARRAGANRSRRPSAGGDEELMSRIVGELESLRRAQQALSEDVASRLARIEQTVECAQIEIERVGENQRFMSKVIGNRSAPEQP